MRLLLRQGNPRGLPAEYFDHVYKMFDRATQRAVLKLYRNTRNTEDGARQLTQALRPLDLPVLGSKLINSSILPLRQYDPDSFLEGIGIVRRNLFWLSDEQWKRIKPHLPTDVRGVERADDRRVISGIVHVLKSGCRWCDCPPEYGPPTTIYNRFVRWAPSRIRTSARPMALLPAPAASIRNAPGLSTQSPSRSIGALRQSGTFISGQCSQR
jgi:hypothetical protein